MTKKLIELKDVDKFFPGVHALDKVCLDVEPGEVHVLLGENGAGKSTLMKVITGVYQKDGGKIIYKGEEIDYLTPKKSQELGISIIYQEFNLFPHMTVAENIFIGREPLKSKGIINDKKIRDDARKILQSLNLDIKPQMKVSQLSVGKQQMVEIAKAISTNAELLIMDEPTAALTETEIEELFKVIGKLKKRDVGIVYISHRLEELEVIADRVSVMRDGKYIKTVKYEDTTLEELIGMMVGRTIENKFPKKISKKIGKEVLKVVNLNKKGVLKNINLSLREGEILGLSGLMGAGRTELARVIFGADSFDSGEIYLKGKKVMIKSPIDAIEKGIAYLTEDRKKDGLVLNLDVKDNIALANISNFANDFKIVDDEKIKKEASKYVSKLSIKTPSIYQKAKNLSGGNQQKVIIGRWLCRDSEILIIDEPTRGIDVGAKLEVYNLMNQLVEDGASIIMISSELPEILGMSDRVIVMHEGKISGNIDCENANQEKIMHFATGGA